MRALALAGALLLAACSNGTSSAPKLTCTPACPSGLTCTTGHCGPIACGSATSCPSGLTCIAGFCASQSCAPACAAGQVCLDQVCVAAGADAGALTCAAPYQPCTSATGDAYCAATLSDSSNCGGCGSACGPGEVCNGAGTCAVACAADEVVCADRCVSLATDQANCGVCGSSCAAGQVCTAGACAATCAPPEVACGASCADTSVDPGNCGGCGTTCAAGQLCVAGACTVGCGGELAACDGVCTDLQFDDANCGACAASCGGSQRCLRGQCDACGAAGELCCSAEVCDASASCTDEVCVASDAGSDGGFTILALLAGQLGGSGDLDGTGAAARFTQPASLAYDGVGNLYVSDTNDCLIRKVDLATDAVTVFAGSTVACANMDGVGTAALFGHPAGIVYDGAGNLYVVDSIYSVVRRIVIATATVTTIAGSTIQGSADEIGVAATFDEPQGLALDAAGNLYIADTGNSTIRQMNLASGVVTTLAGSAGVTGSADGNGPAASFSSPQGLAYDGSANLYVSDTGNLTIRRIALATGAVTTIAGTAGVLGNANGTGAAASFEGPAGLVCDGAGNLFVADTYSCEIRQIVLATGAVTSLAGQAPTPGSADGIGAAARFDNPAGVTFDGVRTLYVADTQNDTIRSLVIATQAVTTLAGLAPGSGSADGTGAAASFEQPSGLTFDGAGSLYVADTANDTIRKITVASGAVTTFAGTAGVRGSVDATGAAASFTQPSGLLYDGNGTLYVADTFNFTIREIATATGAVTTLAGTPGNLGDADGVGPAAAFGSPTWLASDGAGNLYVADPENNAIRAIAVATATVTTLAGSEVPGSADGVGAAASFFGPGGLAYDGAGNLYVTDSGNDTLRKIVLATAEVTTIAGTAHHTGSADGIGAAAAFDGPDGLAYDGAGNLFVADSGNSTIRVLALATGAVTTLAGIPRQYGVVLGLLPAGLSAPAGLAFDFSSGSGETLFLSDVGENAVLEIIH